MQLVQMYISIAIAKRFKGSLYIIHPTYYSMNTRGIFGFMYPRVILRRFASILLQTYQVRFEAKK